MTAMKSDVEYFRKLGDHLSSLSSQIPLSLGPCESTILIVLIKVSPFLGAGDTTPLSKRAVPI